MKHFDEQADDGLVEVMEQTIHARVLKLLDEPLHNIVRNAVREAVTTASDHRPVQGGRCRQVWDALDAVQHLTGETPSLKDAKEIARKRGWNENTARIQYYRWKQETQVSGQA